MGAPPADQQPVPPSSADAVPPAGPAGDHRVAAAEETEAGLADATLVSRLRAGDEAAFVALVERHGAALASLARCYVPDAAADDVVQETWIAVLRGIDRFEGRASLRTWMMRILANIARDRGERERRGVPLPSFADPPGPDEPAVDRARFRPAGDVFPGGWVSFPARWDEQPEQRYLSTEGVEIARVAIEALPPAQRAVVTLRDVEDWSSDEVSEALGITPGNERVLLHRGRSRVRAALEATIGERRVAARAGR